MDLASLETDLRARTEAEVRFDAGSRAAYATDASNYRQVPIAVVVPRSVDDVIAAVATCRDHGAPVLPRGAGTSLAGQACNVAVVIDCSKYLRRVLAVDAATRRARVEPGCVLDDLRSAAALHGLTFGPDPVTHAWCSLGGMIGNNACGVHSVVAGRTADNVASLDVLTYDGLRLRVGPTTDAEADHIVAAGGRRGEIYGRLRHLRDEYADEVRRRFPDIPRRVSGYNLDELLPERGFDVARALVGTEGTCVTVLEAEVHLVPEPPATSLVVLGYPDLATAGDQVPEVMASRPRGLEGVDLELLETAAGILPRAGALLPDGRAWLYVELGGESVLESESAARALMARLARLRPRPSMRIFTDGAETREVWRVREAGVGATARERGGTRAWPGWEDAAVAPADVGPYLRGLRKLLDRFGHRAAVYGHLGDGCVHARIDFDLASAAGIARYRAFVEEAADLVLSLGGSLSGEHGDGQSRAELLPRMFGPDLVRAFEEFKAVWDPAGRMNPGKVVRPRRLDQDLSLASAVSSPCVGVGACRRTDAGTMCPSYMVTREERDSTRGRARLLEEMLRGEVITEGWRATEVRDALDLCLSCKACRRECPAGVDIAADKAEFLYRHYQGRVRPASHYSMGWLPLWAAAGSRAPQFVNRLMGTSGLRRVLKRVAGVDARRPVPPLAPTTFRSWFAARPPAAGRTPRGDVVLWPDTFTDHFWPERGRAAVGVLEAGGYRVRVPDGGLCCGLTWITTGQLGTARRVLSRTVARLAADDPIGSTPFVGLEPSCTAVLRSDLVELLPRHEAARAVAGRTVTLAELLQGGSRDWTPPPLGVAAVVQGHCHQRAVMEMGDDQALLSRLGVDAELLDSGCCGMAGSFGFERSPRGETGHYFVSMACAERVLLPAVRRASPETLVVADGYSCRLQIEHATGRRALHLAEVARLALRG